VMMFTELISREISAGSDSDWMHVTHAGPQTLSDGTADSSPLVRVKRGLWLKLLSGTSQNLRL
jgi:hypothetical protein